MKPRKATPAPEPAAPPAAAAPSPFEATAPAAETRSEVIFFLMFFNFAFFVDVFLVSFMQRLFLGFVLSS